MCFIIKTIVFSLWWRLVLPAINYYKSLFTNMRPILLFYMYMPQAMIRLGANLIF